MWWLNLFQHRALLGGVAEKPSFGASVENVGSEARPITDLRCLGSGLESLPSTGSSRSGCRRDARNSSDHRRAEQEARNGDRRQRLRLLQLFFEGSRLVQDGDPVRDEKASWIVEDVRRAEVFQEIRGSVLP